MSIERREKREAGRRKRIQISSHDYMYVLHVPTQMWPCWIGRQKRIKAEKDMELGPKVGACVRRVEETYSVELSPLYVLMPYLFSHLTPYSTCILSVIPTYLGTYQIPTLLFFLTCHSHVLDMVSIFLIWPLPRYYTCILALMSLPSFAMSLLSGLFAMALIWSVYAEILHRHSFISPYSSVFSKPFQVAL